MTDRAPLSDSTLPVGILLLLYEFTPSRWICYTMLSAMNMISNTSHERSSLHDYRFLLLHKVLVFFRINILLLPTGIEIAFQSITLSWSSLQFFLSRWSIRVFLSDFHSFHKQFEVCLLDYSSCSFFMTSCEIFSYSF